MTNAESRRELSAVSPILVVDDSRLARMMVRRCLTAAGFDGDRIIEAGNGRAALDRMGREFFALVVVDLNMPVMDGESMLRRMRCTPALLDVPVIVISSTVNRERELALLAVGASCVLAKPVTAAALRRAIRSIEEKTG